MELILCLNNSKVWKLVFANLYCGSACWNNVLTKTGKKLSGGNV